MTQYFEAQMAQALQSGDERSIARWEYLRADLAHFVQGGRITWDYMRWLNPKKYEHWEIRSIRPRPSIRVLGRFAQPDVFVATHAVERTTLKEKWSFEWEYEKLCCEERWKAALGAGCAPFVGAVFEDYITSNASLATGVLP